MRCVDMNHVKIEQDENNKASKKNIIIEPIFLADLLKGFKENHQKTGKEVLEEHLQDLNVAHFAELLENVKKKDEKPTPFKTWIESLK